MAVNTGPPWSVSMATPPQLVRLAEMLRHEGLPHRDLRLGARERYLAATGPDRALIGGVGLELRPPHGLLRSLIVAKAVRGSGLGRQLVTAAETIAGEEGVETLYLLTLDKSAFFVRLGYEETDREAVPTEILGTGEFASLCPASAPCLSKRLDAASGRKAGRVRP